MHKNLGNYTHILQLMHSDYAAYVHIMHPILG